MSKKQLCLCNDFCEGNCDKCKGCDGLVKNLESNNKDGIEICSKCEAGIKYKNYIETKM